MHFSGQAMPPFGNYIIDQLVYDGMRENFEHEYVHFKQNELYKAATGRPLPSPSTFEKWEEYIKKPMEHMAFAAQELQWIKNKMHNIKPQEILRYLSKWGLTRNTRLDNLKRTDYDSWKNIMKYASMFALQDMAKKSTGTAKAVRLP
jgi:dihydroxyacetone kinase-like predicted kinase